MSRTSRGDTDTRPVSTRLILDAEHSSRSATSSQVSFAASRSLRSSSASLRRLTVGLCALAIHSPPACGLAVKVSLAGPGASRPVRCRLLVQKRRANFAMHVAHQTLQGASLSSAITLSCDTATRGDRMTMEAQQAQSADTWRTNLARLEGLAEVLASHGLRTRLMTPPGR